MSRFFVLKHKNSMLASVTGDGRISLVIAGESRGPHVFVDETDAQNAMTSREKYIHEFPAKEIEVVEVEILVKKKKKARKEFKYRTYEGEPGNAKQWRAQAEAMAAHIALGADGLTILGLSKLPANLDELKKARRIAMLKAHPDRGHNEEDAIKINQAYEALEKLLLAREVAPRAVASDKPGLIRPLLAGDIDIDALSEIKFPCYGSPKSDGIRGLKVDGKALARSFKPIPNNFIRTWIEANAPDGFDGEIVVLKADGTPYPINKVTSFVMSEDGEPNFEWRIFDYVSGELTEEFQHRIKKAEEKVKELNLPRIKIVPHKILNNAQELLAYEKECLDAGFEGVVVRAIKGPYKCDRSTVNEGYLLRLVRWKTAEAEVLDFYELMHNMNTLETNELGLSKRSSAKAGKVGAGSLGGFHVRDVKSGVEFKIATGEGLGAAVRDEVWKNKEKYRNKIVKYKFKSYGVLNKPRQPIWLGFRDERDMS